jgi:anti-sigma regulatory factor (Ser/Thr protein kinase)
VIGTVGTHDESGLEHPAFLYESVDDFLGLMVPFVTGGLDSGEPVFVAAKAGNLAALRAEIGEHGPAVRWADAQDWHPHPGRRLRAFHELVTDGLRAGARRVRLVGEPVWPPGAPELVLEWQRYESVLNVVLGPFPVTLVCLYDASGLDSELVTTAQRTHPTISRGGPDQLSTEFEQPEDFLSRCTPELAAPPPWAARMTDPPDLISCRRFLTDRALLAGVDPQRAMDLSVAANEVLTNAMVHGHGTASLSAWTDGDRFVCQIQDHGGRLTDAVTGYRPPEAERGSGRGLWIVRQLVDLLQIVPGGPGMTVRLHVTLDPDGHQAR